MQSSATCAKDVSKDTCQYIGHLLSSVMAVCMHCEQSQTSHSISKSNSDTVLLCATFTQVTQHTLLVLSLCLTLMSS